MTEKFLLKLSRRAAMQAIGLTGAAALVAPATAQAPAVRKRVTLSYWTWTDNPGHQKLLVDVVDGFNKSQDMITIQLDAGSRTMEVRQKVMVAYAAGAAPDIAGAVQTHVQDYLDSGVLWPVDPFFSKWHQNDDYSEYRRLHAIQARAACALYARSHPALCPVLSCRLVRRSEGCAAEDVR